MNHDDNDGGDDMRLTRRDLLVVALSAAFAGSAWGHGPSRQKVELTVDIAAPADKVWARVANFHDMSWHPAVARTEGQGGNEVGASRVLTLKGEGDPTITEQLTRYSAEAMSYSYKITQVDVKVLPVTNYVAHLTVTADGEGKSKVQWRGAFYRGFPNNDPPPELNDQAAITAVTGVYRGGLDALKAELER